MSRCISKEVNSDRIISPFLFPQSNYSYNVVGEIAKQQYYVGLSFTVSGKNDENGQKETNAGLREEDLKLWRPGRLGEGCGGRRSGVSAGKEALVSVKVVNCVSCMVGRGKLAALHPDTYSCRQGLGGGTWLILEKHVKDLAILPKP